jgi:hypothetical protein
VRQLRLHDLPGHCSGFAYDVFASLVEDECKKDGVDGLDLIHAKPGGKGNQGQIRALRTCSTNRHKPPSLPARDSPATIRVDEARVLLHAGSQ